MILCEGYQGLLIVNKKFRGKLNNGETFMSTGNNMEIIDTYWEERNLGVKSFEIVLSKDDNIEEFLYQEKFLLENGAKYIVVKAPVNVSEFLFELPKAGYIFMEAAFSLQLKRKNYICPPFIARFDRNFVVRKLETSGAIQHVYDEIARGIFNSDRIALDKHFTQSVASNRYINWIKDVVNQGNDLYEVCLNNDAVGFFVLKRIDDKKVQGILTGTYEKYLTSGIGAVVGKKLCETVWSLGYTSFYAAVVSSNVKALRANLLFGYEIVNITHNYVKHVQ